MRRSLSLFCLVAACLIALFPVISGLMETHRQQEAVSTFRQEASTVSADRARELEQEARAWNEARRHGQPLSGDYDQILDITQTGIMATLSIPKISVNLPVYHGTGEEVLSAGAGHVEFSDLPLGEPGYHSVLSAHRGMPSARLFTRLDELKAGDLFFVDTPAQSLAYEVTDIQVVEPEDTGVLDPVPGQDLVSLVTCTPYGINTHRLVVTGRRTTVDTTAEDEQAPAVPSARELAFLLAPTGFGAAAFLLYRRKETT